MQVSVKQADCSLEDLLGVADQDYRHALAVETAFSRCIRQITAIGTNIYDLGTVPFCGINVPMTNPSYDTVELLARIRTCNGAAAAATVPGSRVLCLNEAVRYGQMLQKSWQTPVLLMEPLPRLAAAWQPSRLFTHDGRTQHADHSRPRAMVAAAVDA